MFFSKEISLDDTETQAKLFRIALILSVFTIFYNLIEGILATSLGFQDETLALFGFGIDSYIEVASGLGIAYMVVRIQQNPESARGSKEVQALRITGIAFHLLALSLFIGIVWNIWQGHKPQTTFWGLVIALVSIVSMYGLSEMKIRLGRKLDSAPIIADGRCTKVCLYMSLVLFFASLIYELTGFAYADVLGASGIIYYAVQEGREALDKAQGKETCACGDTCSGS